jgi:amino acid adenylation domain-containing protein
MQSALAPSSALSVPWWWLDNHIDAPEAAALVDDDGGIISREELAAAVRATVAALIQCGVGREDRLALAMMPGPARAVGLLAGMAVTTVAPLAQSGPQTLVAEELRRLRVTRLLVDGGAPPAVVAAAVESGVPVLTLDPLRLPAPSLLPLTTPAADGVALLLQSSGTTARPKIVPLSHGNLLAGASAVCEVLALGPTDRTLAAMPLFHVHGIVATLLAPLLAGGSVVCCQHRSPPRLLAQLATLRPTWLSASPTLLLGLLEAAERSGMQSPPHQLRVLRSVTMPLAPTLRTRLEAVFRVPVLEVYGMTEAASQVCSSRLPASGVDRRPGTVGPASGPEVAVLGPDGTPRPRGVSGEVVIRGACVTRGYEGEPQNGWRLDARGEPWFSTGDEGSLDESGCLTLHGRFKEMFNRGGMKVTPARVDAALSRHPAVREALAFAVPHPTLGEELAAAVVVSAGATIDEEALRDYVATILPAHEVPSRILRVDALPRAAGGKLRRSDVAARLADQLRAPTQPATNEMEQLVEGVFAEVLQMARPGRDANFFLVGGDSLSSQRVIHRLEQHLGVELAPTLLFRYPLVRTLARHLAALETSATHEAPAIPAARPLSESDRPAAAEFLASFAQSRLWFLHQFAPTLPAYHLVSLWRLRGDLNQPALEQALCALIDRHPTLRTSFRLHGSTVRQLIRPSGALPLRTDVLGDRDPDAVINAWLDEEYATPFDLVSGQLLRSRLLRLGPGEHLLLITHHHIASDGWSTGVLAKDLVALYNAARTGEPTTLPPLATHYHDYAAWQHERLEGPRLHALRDYWSRQLDGLAPLDLPTDRPRPTTPSHRGAAVAFEVEPALLGPFEALCRAEGVTTQMGLLAVLSLLLSRHSRQDDLAIGIPMWGRGHLALEPLIGFFVNTVPIRVRLADAPPFRALLDQVRRTSLDAYQRQELPFEQIVNSVQVERDTSRNPLAQVLLQYVTMPTPALHGMADLTTAKVPTRPRAVRFDLECSVRRTVDGGLHGDLLYATDLFDAPRIERLGAQLVTLLRGVVADPDASIDALTLLPDPERALIERWGRGEVSAEYEGGVHEYVEAQATRTPHAIAIEHAGVHVTYAQLDARANQFAHLLREIGVRDGSLVAVCLERSVDLIVTLLAILKAGGAYVPLDPGWPEERRQQLVRTANALVLVTQREAVWARAFPPQRRVELDTLDVSSHSTAPLSHVGCRANTLAYVLYTSGSTGIPKGVQSEHRVLTNLVDWHRSDPRLRTPARTLQFASCVFDVSLQEVFVTLSTGGTLVLIGEEERRDFTRLRRCLTETRIERLFMPYVALEQLAVIATHDGAGGLVLRDIISAGEQLVLSGPVRAFLAALPSCRLHNHYGPTESHVVTAWQLVPSSFPNGTEGLREVPIGTPIRNATIKILDRSGALTPIGVPGALHIGGAGLARGYLDDEALTARRFTRDLETADPSARLYASGDLASWNADGTIAFHGRLDRQVKLRGYRIEPGEIEAHLAAHPVISQVAVVLRTDAPAQPRLVAYWVAHAGGTTDARSTASDAALASVLRMYLAERLPHYMVPAAFVRLDSFPLTSNGKLDHRALPSPATADGRGRTGEFATVLEAQLHAIWTDVVGHGDFGSADNFFMIGGHSLAAAQLIARIEKEFGTAPRLAALFQSPTIGAQARLIEGMAAGASPRIVALQPHGFRPPLFIVHGWGGSVMGWVPLARALAPQRPVYGVQAAIAANGQPTRGTVEELAAEYAEDILRVQPNGAIHLLGYSAGGWYAHAVADALLQRGATIGAFVVLDTHPTARMPMFLRPVFQLQWFIGRLRVHVASLQHRPELRSRTRHWIGRLRALLRDLIRGQAVVMARDPFAALHSRYRPARLPIAAELIAVSRKMRTLRWLWRFHARRGVRSYPLFADHRDFLAADNAPALADVVEGILQRADGGSA